LQRGHIAELAAMAAGQRGEYQRIFGDPLDWVRRRLGHRSAATTLKYMCCRNWRWKPGWR